ncbi:hypothetical protein CR513_40562, partial [Mucuna pruriens]
MSGNKGPTLMWDIRAFSKEEIDCFRTLLNSTSKPLGLCVLTMKDKSSFNISGSVPLNIWILDSKATDHMTLFPSYFTSYFKVFKNQLITIANGDHFSIVRFDNVQLQSSVSLHNVFHVPKLANNLISIHRLIQDWNCEAIFFRSHCVTTSIRRICLPINGQPQKLGQLLKFDFIINVLDIHCLVYLRQCFHIYLQKSMSSPLIVMFVSSQNTFVQHFLIGIIKVFTFDLIHFDVWGQLVTLYWGLSDNDIEFVNLEFSKFLKNDGVVHELTCENTPKQNGVAERKNCHLFEVARTLLFQVSIANVYWGEAILTATYLINRLPIRVLNGISPIKYILSFSPSSLLILSLPSHVFGCVVLSTIHIVGSEILELLNCYLEVELVIESLPFPTQDVQVQEVILEELITEKAHNEVGEED